MTEERVIPGGTPKWVRDATANDSDKSWTVPAGKVWNLKYVWGNLVTTATVGSRIFGIRIYQSGTDQLWRSNDATIAASQSGHAILADGVFSTSYTLGNNGGVINPLPDMMLTEGMIIRVLDSAAIDAAADDLTVVLHYIEYDA